MDIRGCQVQIKKLKRVNTNVKDLHFNAEDIEIPVIMIHDENGKLVEFIRGYNEIKSFLKYGYNRIIKKCPYRHRNCIGEKCSLYFIEGLTGDCVLIWQMFKGR